MTDQPSPAKLGLTDEELAAHPTMFAADALKDQVVVVTGGAGGIGRAIAWLFARLGAHVAVVGRDGGKLDALVAQLAGRGLKASAHISRHPGARCGQRPVRHDLGRAWPRRQSHQQRRRTISASGDRFFREGLERRHQHQSERHLVHDAGRRATLARPQASRQHRQHRGRDDAWPLRHRPHHRRAKRRDRAVARRRGRMGAA